MPFANPCSKHDENNPPARRNGFSRPFHKQQMISWLGYFIQIACFFTITFPCFTGNEKIGITAAFMVTWVTFNVAFILATLETHDLPSPEANGGEEGFDCSYCHTKVIFGSKHCRSCNLCRLRFDHHCFFLNNCVTENNYDYFLVGILALGANSVLMTLLSVYIIMNEEMEGFALAQASYFYGSICSKGVFYTFHSLLMLMNLGIEVFMVYLYALHTVLAVRNATTFEFILHRRQKQNEERARKLAQLHVT